jgi:PAS domain S-box-containing protein
MKEANIEPRDLETLDETLFQHPSDLVFLKDTEHRIARANERYASLFETTSREIVGQRTQALHTGERLESILEDERRVIEGDEVRDRDRRFSRSDAAPSWYSISYVPHSDAHGRVQGVLGIGRDISARKRTEREMNLFKNAIEATGHAVYITDPDGTIEYANPAFEAITGYPRAEAVGRNPRILKSGEMQEDYYDELWETILDGTVWEEEVINRRNDGELYRAHQTIAPISDRTGDLTAFVAIQTDVTEWKRTETTLRRYRQMVENSTNLLAAIDRTGTFVFANEQFRKFHGLGDGDLSAVTPADVIGEKHYTAIEPYLERVYDGEVVEFETTRKNANGEPRRLDIRGYPLREDDGTVVGAAVAMKDVTDEYEKSQQVELLAEYRRVMSSVNRVLVRTDDVETMLERVTEIVSSSELFVCTFGALVDETAPTFVCNSGSEPDEESAASFHTEAYLDRVFEEGFYWMDDVTEPPFAQHGPAVPSHPGVGIALRHGDDRYGVLTVHFQRGLEPDEESSELLTQVADDIGFFLHGRALERERTRKERQLREEKRRYESLFESIRDAILVADTDRRIVNCNDAFEELFGYDCEEIAGKGMAFVYENDGDDAAMGDALDGHGEGDGKRGDDPQFNDTATYEKRSGQTFPGETNVFYLRGYDGEIRGFIGLIRDVSDREDRLQQLQVIDRVLRHNVNNDMNVIQGYAEMIADSGSDAVVTHAEHILGTSEKLLETTAKERQITRFLSEGRSGTQIPARKLVSDVVSDVRAEYPGADIETTLPTNRSPTVTSSVSTAIEELLDNAVTHSDRETPSIDVRAWVTDDVVRIRVADDGPGIPAMEREVLSGQADIGPLYHGSGLGLWLVNLVVSDVDGVLEFEDIDPRGSAVTIRLPI